MTLIPDGIDNIGDVFALFIAWPVFILAQKNP